MLAEGNPAGSCEEHYGFQDKQVVKRLSVSEKKNTS